MYPAIDCPIKKIDERVVNVEAFLLYALGEGHKENITGLISHNRLAFKISAFLAIIYYFDVEFYSRFVGRRINILHVDILD